MDSVINLAPIWGAIGATLVALTVLFASISLYIRLREFRYNEEKNKVELELLRKSKEAQIYNLVKRMSSTKERWKDLNHILLDSSETLLDTAETIRKSSGGITLSPQRYLSTVGIEIDSLEVEKGKVFFLTPFHEQFDETYRTVREVGDELGVSISRGDETHAPGLVVTHILKEILQSEFVIANLDGRNPNVFYELGVAQAIGKPTIMIASSDNDIPFDLASSRTLIWKTKEELASRLTSLLAKTLISGREERTHRH